MTGRLLAISCCTCLSGCGQVSPLDRSPGRDLARVQTAARIANPGMLQDAARTFFRDHPDDFDMLVVWGSEQSAPEHAFYLPVQNDVPGIGYQHVGPEFFDHSSEFDSRRLQGVIWMGTSWLDDARDNGLPSVLAVLAQETAHRWGSTIHFQRDVAKSSSPDLLGRPFHWSFFLETGGSPLGGNHWVALGDHVFQAEPVDEVSFHSLDLYLMGLIPAGEVPPLRLLVNARSVDDDTVTGFSALGGRVSHAMKVRAEVLEIDMGQVIKAEGPREPDRGFNASYIRQAWIHLVHGTQSASFKDLQTLAVLQEAWPGAFFTMTGGRSRISTALTP